MLPQPYGEGWLAWCEDCQEVETTGSGTLTGARWAARRHNVRKHTEV